MQKSTLVWILVILILIGGGLYYRQTAQEVDSRGATRLMRALEENDTSKMRQFLDNTPDVHARDKQGQTALFYAARYATDPLVLHKLVTAGADTFATDKHGYTPLMTAAEYNPSPRVVMALARYGRFLQPQAANKDKALALAARHNTAEIINTLLVAGANPSAVPGGSIKNLFAENPQLTEQEKTDLRQVIMLLELLEAREKFQQENYPRSAAKPSVATATAPKSAPREVPAGKQTLAAKEPAQEVTAVLPAPAPDESAENTGQPAQETPSPVQEAQPLLDSPAANPLVVFPEK